jgi:predicted unusual protein kinase regulating ubiquinone biosynthesis (AarF/ABC1/UbiB family)
VEDEHALSEGAGGAVQRVDPSAHPVQDPQDRRAQDPGAPRSPDPRARRARRRALRIRYYRILRFAAEQVIHMWWFNIVLPMIGLRRFSARGQDRRMQASARSFHDLAADLGGLMIKLGQFMSTRMDVLPAEVTVELAGLQDEAPAVPFEQVRRLAEESLGAPLARVYESFDPAPMAAASLGQVHRARLSPVNARVAGFRDVVVKVQRPGIGEVVETDLSALRKVAHWFMRFQFISDRVDAPGLVEEFGRISRLEIDYLNEGANADRFAEESGADPRIGYPRVAWEQTTRRVLTLSDVSAVKIKDLEGIRAAGIDPAEVARELASMIFDQLFGTGFFHADPHPGNLFVTPLDPDRAQQAGQNWELTFVDFGMMGQVPPTLKGGLREAMIAIGSRDGQRLVKAMKDVDLLLPTADIGQLERLVIELFEQFGGMGLAELRHVDPSQFIRLGRQFRELMESMPFQLPQDFLLIIRTVSLLSGLCQSLDPDFNIWDAVQPYATRLIEEEGGGPTEQAAREAVGTLRVLAELPRRADHIISLVERGQLSVETPEIDRLLKRIERAIGRAISAIVFVGLLIGGILLHPVNAPLGIVLMAVSAIPLIHALFFGNGR